METKGTEVTGKIFDDGDNEWYPRELRYVSKNQEGEIAGHYMQVDGASVTTNAISSNEKTVFKTYSGLTDNLIPVVILENKENGSVIAIDKTNDSIIAKSLATSPSSYNTLEEVKTAHPEILFYKMNEPGSDYFYFKSFLKDKQRILGFDANGNPLNPTQVQPNQKECLFHLDD